jgi:hypothetical protein
VEVVDIFRDQVLKDAGISTYCYRYWLTPLPKKKIEILEVIGSTPALSIISSNHQDNGIIKNKNEYRIYIL